jgi:hypothetical protein
VPVILDINDVWPYQLTHILGFHEESMPYRLLDLFGKFSYRHASRVTVISPGYVSVLKAQGGAVRQDQGDPKLVP